MDSNIRQHWAEIKGVEADLIRTHGDGTPYADQTPIHVVSRERRKLGVTGGRVAKVTIRQAALLIAQETHQVATEAEASAWEREQQERSAAIRQEAAKRESKVNLDLGPFAELLLSHNAAAHRPVDPPLAPKTAKRD